MENISPTLLLLLSVRGALESGFSVRTGILNFLKLSEEIKKSPTHKIYSDSFMDFVSLWLLLIDQGQDFSFLYKDIHPCKRTLLHLLEKGLKGMPVLNLLNELEMEITKSCEDEINEHIQKIPILLLLPVLFLMFPAYLILLLGPVIESIMDKI